MKPLSDKQLLILANGAARDLDYWLNNVADQHPALPKMSIVSAQECVLRLQMELERRARDLPERVAPSSEQLEMDVVTLVKAGKT